MGEINTDDVRSYLSQYASEGMAYLESRCDSENALFVSLGKPYRRFGISGVESRLRKLTREKFRLASLSESRRLLCGFGIR